MKNKLLLLIKKNFKSLFKFKFSKVKTPLIIIIAIYLIGCLILSFGYLLYGMYNQLDSFNLTNYFIPIGMLFILFICFILSIFTTKSFLFDNKDNDFLLSLPIKKETILASRVISVIAYNFAISLLFIIPMVFIYLSYNTFTLSFLIMIVSITLFVSILPTILASIVGYVIAAIISKSKFKASFEVFLNFLVVILYLGFYYGFNAIISIFASNISVVTNIMKYVFYPIYLMLQYSISGNIIYILLYILFNIILFLLFIYILKGSYFRIISSLAEVDKRKIKIKKEKRGVLSTLINKELKRYFGCPIYVFNTIFGMIFLVIAGVASFFYDKSDFLNMVNLNINISSFGFILLAVVFMTLMTNTTSSSISIERDNFWIIKSLPILTKDIFISKISVNLIITIPFVFVSLIMFILSSYITIVDAIYIFVLAICLSILSSLFGLVVNLIFPKLDAISDVDIVKKSMSTFVSMMTLILVSMAFAIIIVFNNIYRALFILYGISFLSISLLILVVIFYGKKKFDNI